MSVDPRLERRVLAELALSAPRADRGDGGTRNGGRLSVSAQVSEPTDLADELQRLVGERAARRRIAALAAGDAPESEVLKSIAAEVAGLLGVDQVRIWRFEGDTATAVASAGMFHSAMPVGWREPLRDDSLAGRVRRTGRSQRVDDYAEVDVRLSRRALEIGVGSAAATPIVVAGRPWGAIVAASRHAWRLPVDAETCMDQFAELTAPAIARAESHAGAGRLADEQAAVRRVGMVVAGGGPAAGRRCSTAQSPLDRRGAWTSTQLSRRLSP